MSTDSIDVEIAAKRWEESEALLREIPESDFRLPHAMKLSLVLHETSRNQQVIDLLMPYRKQFPGNPWIAFRLAEACLSLDRMPDARQYLESITTENPSLLLRADRSLAGLDLLDGNFANGWKRIRRTLLGDLPENDRLLSFFKNTFELRIRTNSLHSTWSSSRFTDRMATVKLAAHIASAIKDVRPYSFIRLGDGEGRFLTSSTKPLAQATSSQSGTYEIPSHELSMLRSQLIDACVNSDTLGLAREDMTSPEYRSSITALGEPALDRMETGECIVTDCHAHYALTEIGELAELLRICNLPVLVIGSRDISSALRQINSSSEVRWLEIPTEKGHGELKQAPHYPNYFNYLRSKLDASGSLVLVAAGILGKIYCGWAKQQGGIAIDIGAVADLWVGQTTRSYVRLNSLSFDT